LAILITGCGAFSVVGRARPSPYGVSVCVTRFTVFSTTSPPSRRRSLSSVLFFGVAGSEYPLFSSRVHSIADFHGFLSRTGVLQGNPSTIRRVFFEPLWAWLSLTRLFARLSPRLQADSSVFSFAEACRHFTTFPARRLGFFSECVRALDTPGSRHDLRTLDLCLNRLSQMRSS